MESFYNVEVNARIGTFEVPAVLSDKIRAAKQVLPRGKACWHQGINLQSPNVRWAPPGDRYKLNHDTEQ